MEDPDDEIYETKVEKVVKFNKYYNALNYFSLKDNELYQQVFKVRQPKNLIVCDYSVPKIIEKVYT